MKCCSHHTFGVIIGSLYLMICIFVFIVMTTSLIENSLKEEEDDYVKPNEPLDTISSMVKCLLLAFVCGLLIWGIVKRRPYYMLPWLIAYVIVFAFSCVYLFAAYIGAQLFGGSKEDYVGLAIIATVSTILQIIIFIFMCNLFRIIRNENNQNSGSVIYVPQMAQQSPDYSYTMVDTKTGV
ncbi:uncharacterized protein ACRADG_010672 isoform 1-T1 [Cochliomyia hominivorax]